MLSEEEILQQTFEKCFNSFVKHFSRPDWFKACSTLCFLLEAQLLSKAQRIVAFYILYEVYHHEPNVESTPFEAVVLNTLQTY